MIAKSLDEAETRTFCEQISRGMQAQTIRRHSQPELPYLVRYFVAGWNPENKRHGPAIYLHHFLGGDPAREVHSHPWQWSASLILVGGYREERCSGREGATLVTEFRPGDVNVLAPGDRHRIDLLDRDCWSLFLAGSFAQAWRFYESCRA